MFLDKLFGSVFGSIILVLLMVGSAELIVWLYKKNSENEKNIEVKTENLVEKARALYNAEYNGCFISEDQEGKFHVLDGKNKNVLKTLDNEGDCKIFIDVMVLRTESESSKYEIVEIDGAFKVRKKGSTHVLRKFASREEAVKFVEEKENDR